MPSLIERLGSRVMRSSVGEALFGEERRRLRETAQLLQEAYLRGPWDPVYQPETLARKLREVDPYILADVLSSVGWETIGYTLDASAQRQRAIQDSRRLYKYSPAAQWAIWLWTSWGLGDNVSIDIDHPEVRELWEEFWTADRNRHMLADDVIHELSNWLLVDGNTFLTVYGSTVDGEATIGEIPPGEIKEIVTMPGNKRHPLFYRREWQTQEEGVRTWYYPDYQAFLTGELDRPYRGSEQTLAQTVLPRGAVRADTHEEVGAGKPPWREEQLGGAGENLPDTVVCVLHVHHNHKERFSLWGWPLLTTAGPWLQTHREFIESRLAVAKSKAAFVRRKRVESGSRGVDRMISAIESNLGRGQTTETNPPPAPGSTEVENAPVTTEDLPMTTGAADAKADNALFAWHALLGTGLFPASAGLDLQRYATALAMDKSQSMLWTRYQTFWSAQFRKLVAIVEGYNSMFEQRNSHEDEERAYSATVSVDTFSLADFPDVADSLAPLVGEMLLPLQTAGVIPTDTAREIAAALWRVVLQALGVGGSSELVSDEAFGVQTEEQRERQAEADALLSRMADVIRENAERGTVDWEAVASWALDNVVE